MMLAPLLALALAAQSAASEPKTSPGPVLSAALPSAPPSLRAAEQLLVLGLDAIDVSREKVSILDGRIASILAERTDVETVTAADIKAMALVDANRAQLGCDETSCLAEMANALGARYVLFGRVGKLDDLIFLQVNLFDARVGKSISRQEAQGEKLGDLSQQLPDVLRALLRPLGGADAVATAETKPMSPWVLGGGITGSSGLLVAGASAAIAFKFNGDLTNESSTLETRESAYQARPWVIGGLALGSVATVLGSGLMVYGLME